MTRNLAPHLIHKGTQQTVVNYISTRGTDKSSSFVDVLLSGLARDGGLFMPAQWPQISAREIAGFSGKPYAQVAFEVARRFVEGEIDDAILEEMTHTAYRRFDHKAIAPLRELKPNQWLLELFHGPTLAFKDIAMQFLGVLMDHALKQQGRRATIIGATSGDTGSAAIEAFRGLETVDVFILHPHERVSDVQRRQMTTVTDDNIHNIALKGTFDDAQAIVKGLFNDLRLRDRIGLAGVNSINWARVMAQITYYFTSAVKLGAPDREVSFTVPTGNFGDILAGYAAKRMGLPIDRLVIATNVNDILARTLSTGVYEVSDVVATASPSMDIQVSSNFERLLFDASRHDAPWVTAAMASLHQSGRFELTDQVLTQIRKDFDAGRADEAQVAKTIADIFTDTGVMLDPHSAVGVAVAQRMAGSSPMISLATAHPAKFPDAVEAATGKRPELPSHLSDLFERPEEFDVIENDQSAIAAHIENQLTKSGRGSRT